MGKLYLAANHIQASGRLDYGHLQIVRDGGLAYAFEEIEVEPTWLVFGGNWKYDPTPQNHYGAETDGTSVNGHVDNDWYTRRELDLKSGQDLESVWQLLVQIRDYLHAGNFGVHYDFHQNSNSYAFSLLSVVGLAQQVDISELHIPDGLLGNGGIHDFPGWPKNIFEGAKTDSGDNTVIPLVLSGTTGNDWMQGGIGIDNLAGGYGNDSIHGGDARDFIYGEFGSDYLRGEKGNDFVYGGDHSDTIYGDEGADHLFGESGDDEIRGGPGGDFLFGGIDNDTIWGEQGADELKGEVGQDTLYGGESNDKLYGDEGDDLLVGQQGDDTLDGGADNDTAQYTNNYSDYRLIDNADGTYTVSSNTTNEGSDTLVSVEFIKFGNQTKTISEWNSLFNGSTSTPTTSPPADATPPAGAPIVPPSGTNSPTDPDFFVSVATLSDNTVDPGQTIKVTWTTTNGGSAYNRQSDAAIFYSTDNAFSTDDVFLGRDLVGSLASGQSMEREEWVTIPTSASFGSGYLFVQVDFEQDFAEGDEQNNASAPIPITVNPPTSGSTNGLPVIGIRSINDGLYHGLEAGSHAFELFVSGTLQNDVNVHWQVVPHPSNPANAADFLNGVFPSGTKKLPAGSTSKTILVPISNDNIAELDEQYSVRISLSGSNSDKATIKIPNHVATGDIFNDDGPIGAVTDGDSLGTAWFLNSDPNSAPQHIWTPKDVDFYQAHLLAGVTYTVNLSSVGNSTTSLSNGLLQLFDGTGAQILFVDQLPGVQDSTQLILTPTSSGTHYFSVSSADASDTGGYQINMLADTGTAYLPFGHVPLSATISAAEPRLVFQADLGADTDKSFSLRAPQGLSELDITVRDVAGKQLSGDWYQYDTGVYNFDFDAADGKLFLIEIAAKSNAGFGTIDLTKVAQGDGLVPQSVTSARVVTTVDATMTLDDQNSSDVWVTSQYYGGGRDDLDLRIGGWGDTYQSLIQFDLSSLPTSVKSASLEFQWYSHSGKATTDIDVALATSAWDESTIWANQPTVGATFASANVVQGTSTVSIDITDQLNDWLSGAVPNHGLVLLPDTNNNTFTFLGSSESGLQPVLHYQYDVVSAPKPPTASYSIFSDGMGLAADPSKPWETYSERFDGTSGNDLIYGGAGVDWFTGTLGDDIYYGGDGTTVDTNWNQYNVYLSSVDFVDIQWSYDPNAMVLRSYHIELGTDHFAQDVTDFWFTNGGWKSRDTLISDPSTDTFVFGGPPGPPAAKTVFNDGGGVLPDPAKPWEIFDEIFPGTDGDDIVNGGSGVDWAVATPGNDEYYGGADWNQINFPITPFSEMQWGYDSATGILGSFHSNLGTDIYDASFDNFWFANGGWHGRSELIGLADPHFDFG